MGCANKTERRKSSIASPEIDNIMNLPLEVNYKKAKVIVMGSLSVGKTSIIKAFVEDKS